MLDEGSGHVVVCVARVSDECFMEVLRDSVYTSREDVLDLSGLFKDRIELVDEHSND